MWFTEFVLTIDVFSGDTYFNIFILYLIIIFFFLLFFETNFFLSLSAETAMSEIAILGQGVIQILVVSVMVSEELSWTPQQCIGKTCFSSIVKKSPMNIVNVPE